MAANDWIVIGISGVTCGGKTTLANKLFDLLTPVYVFNQDKYFYPDDSPKHVKCDGLDHNDYDVLSALDMAAMFDDVARTLRGDDRAHRRASARAARLALAGKRFMVLEGFTVLNYEPIMDVCDLRYYLVLEYGECAARRARRLYEPPDVAGYFEACVWPRHLHYRAQMEADPRVRFVDGQRHDALDVVRDDLLRLGARPVT